MHFVDGNQSGVLGPFVPMPRRPLPHPESPEAVSDRLKRTREAMGLNQAALCEIMGITTQAWNNYERLRRPISPLEAIKLCKVSGATLDWIYRGEMAMLPLDLLSKIQNPPAQKPRKARKQPN